MKPEPIKDVIKGVIKNLTRDAPNREEEILKIWGEAAGRRLASHSRPVSFRARRLIVNVDSSAWLYELTLNRPRILKRLLRGFKGKGFDELQFRIGDIA